MNHWRDCKPPFSQLISSPRASVPTATPITRHTATAFTADITNLLFDRLGGRPLGVASFDSLGDIGGWIDTDRSQGPGLTRRGRRVPPLQSPDRLTGLEPADRVRGLYANRVP